jgi:hypothetical protein
MKNLLLALALVGTSVGAQAQFQVRCENIMYPGTTQIFEGSYCPTGWVAA